MKLFWRSNCKLETAGRFLHCSMWSYDILNFMAYFMVFTTIDVSERIDLTSFQHFYDLYMKWYLTFMMQFWMSWEHEHVFWHWMKIRMPIIIKASNKYIFRHVSILGNCYFQYILDLNNEGCFVHRQLFIVGSTLLFTSSFPY